MPFHSRESRVRYKSFQGTYCPRTCRLTCLIIDRMDFRGFFDWKIFCVSMQLGLRHVVRTSMFVLEGAACRLASAVMDKTTVRTDLMRSVWYTHRIFTDCFCCVGQYSGSQWGPKNFEVSLHKLKLIE